MPRKNINFELDFMKKDIFPRFTVKQFDDVSFNIKPKNQGLDYDTTGMTGKIFVGVNNDMFMQTTGITVSSNNINVLLDKNMLQNRGRAYAEIELTDSNGTITSSSFIFNIDAKIGEGAKIPGEYEGFVKKYERLISEFKTQVNSTIDNCNTNINSTINNCNKAVDNKLNDVDNFIDNKILDIEKRFNTLTSSQQQDAEVIDARVGENGKNYASLGDRLNEVDSQLEHNTSKIGILCSNLGMTKNDTNKQNYEILCEAINNGMSIIFDDLYDVNITSSIDIVRDINITSSSKNFGMNIYSESVVDIFDVIENINISIKNISIINKKESGVFLLDIKEDLKLGNIEISDCIFRNSVAVLYFKGKLDVNPATTVIGFDNFSFVRNELYDNRTSCIQIIDNQFSHVDISYNKIRNFDNIFANLGINNNHKYSNILPSLRKNITITYNDVRCTNDWWNIQTSTLYYTFALTENEYVYYAHNHVEGMKSKYNVALYDLYGSSNNVVSEYNTWKNNLSFVPTCTTNVLMKAKGGGGKRKYLNNRYYAEESFVTSMGYTIDDINLKLFDNTSETDWEIRNNEIECCVLYNCTSSTPIKNLIFNDNILKANRWKDSSLFNLGDGANLTIVNNTIKIEDVPVRFVIIYSMTGYIMNQMILNNNKFHINYNLSGQVHLMYGATSNISIINNNIFNITSLTNVSISYLGDYGDCICEGNTVMCNKFVHFLPGKATNINKYSYDLFLNDTSGVLTGNGIRYYDLISKKEGFCKKYYLEFHISNIDGIKICQTSFTLKVVNENPIISFIPKGKDVAVDYVINSGDGVNTRLSLSNDAIGELIFYNVTSGGWIYLRQNESLGNSRITFNMYAI